VASRTKMLATEGTGENLKDPTVLSASRGGDRDKKQPTIMEKLKGDWGYQSLQGRKGARLYKNGNPRKRRREWKL